MGDEPDTVFKGMTTLNLAPIDIAKAVEYWLNNVVLKTPVGVKTVDKTTAGFIVTILTS